MDRNLSQFLAHDHINRLIEEADRSRLVARPSAERAPRVRFAYDALVRMATSVRTVLALRPRRRVQIP